VVAVDRDGREGDGGAVGVHTVGFEEVLGKLEGGAVEDEAGVGSGLVGEGGEGLVEVGRGRRCGGSGLRAERCGEGGAEKECGEMAVHKRGLCFY
jgi:hypothetical protein